MTNAAPARAGQMLPMEYRLAEVKEVDEEARTVDVVFTTGASVRRMNWWTGEEYDEVLVVDAQAMDLKRLNGGANVLDSHDRYSLGGVLAVVNRAWIEKGQGLATLRFPAKGLRAESDEVLGLIRDKIIRNVSVGYATHKAEWDRTTTPPTRRAVAWEPFEISFVAVGADPGAGTRSASIPVFACEFLERAGPAKENTTMTETPIPAPPGLDATRTVPTPTPTPTPTPAPTPAPTPTPDATRAAIDAAIAADRTRSQTIRQRMRAAGLPDDCADRHVASGVQVEHLNPVIANELASRGIQSPIRTPLNGLDEVETRRGAVEEALLHRYNSGLFKLTDRARPWRGLQLREVARELAEAAGIRVGGLSPMEFAARAMHTTSDFPLIIANVASKTLQAGYGAEIRTFEPFCTRNDLPDFKLTQSTALGEGSDLAQVNEQGEFSQGVVGEDAESWSLLTYGRIFGFTRQLLFNDDMGAFTRLPYLFGQAAARKENDVVWGIFIANAAMRDTVALFHATHNNLQTGAPSALSNTSIASMRQKLRTQKGIDGKQTLNLILRYIIVNSALEGTLEQLMSPLLYAATTSTVVPDSIRSLTPIVEPRLDAISSTVWFGTADKGQHESINYGYLQGQEGVYLETKEGWRVDGVEIKVRHDFGAKAVSWRGMQKSAGA